jgi:hypothetical protein
MTFLLAQHLAAVCQPAAGVTLFNVFNSPAPPPGFNQGVFATYFTAQGLAVPANFKGFVGGAGVAGDMLTEVSAFGYDSPDFLAIYPGAPETTALIAASLINAANHIAYAPTVPNLQLGLSRPGAGAQFVNPPAPANAANPSQWVPLVPVTNAGYPIVGYTSWDAATCYGKADKPAAVGLSAFLRAHYTQAKFKVVAKANGFAAVPPNYMRAIRATFLSNTSGLNLNIDNAIACGGLPGR